MTNPIEKNFYVYLVFRSQLETVPFYVGKGSGKRSKALLCHRSVAYDKVASEFKETLRSEVIAFGMTEKEAYAYEIETINRYGTMLDGGPLINFYKVGSGKTSGHVYTQASKDKMSAARKAFFRDFPDQARESLRASEDAKRTEEYRKRRSELTKKQMSDPEKRSDLLAKLHAGRNSAEAKSKISAARKAQWADPEKRARLIESRRIANSDPEVRKRRGEAIRAGHARNKALRDLQQENGV